jgi:hypothetical protein
MPDTEVDEWKPAERQCRSKQRMGRDLGSWMRGPKFGKTPMDGTMTRIDLAGEAEKCSRGDIQGRVRSADDTEYQTAVEYAR